jgi:hypothetical protein
LVGKRHSGSGELIDNPDAKYAIDGTTRDAISDVIAVGFRDNLTVDEIAANIVGSTALSQERADLIARTEVFSLNNSVALETVKQTGAAMLKEWNTTSDDPCEGCLENESAGPIALDDDFPSGDGAPVLHPRCELLPTKAKRPARMMRPISLPVFFDRASARSAAALISSLVNCRPHGGKFIFLILCKCLAVRLVYI